MSLPVIASYGGKALARIRKQKSELKHVNLEPTPENKALVKKYEILAAEINAIPARIAGLHMNTRKREIPHRVYSLMKERDLKMAKLMEMEKTLFPA